MIRVTELTVRFGAVHSIERLSLCFADAACGLVGPNGAGKTTLLNVLSGFVPVHAGAVVVDDTDILRMRPHLRARWGLRRTFQTEQAIAGLSVYDNVLVALEQSSTPRGRRRSEVLEAIEFVELNTKAWWPAGNLNGAERRLVELARAIVGRPRVILLDEPAAGLTEEETLKLGEMILRIPASTDAQVVLVDHHMELVKRCCSTTAVLDYGSLLAIGPTDQVLRDDRVLRAYLGDEEQETVN